MKIFFVSGCSTIPRWNNILYGKLLKFSSEKFYVFNFFFSIQLEYRYKRSLYDRPLPFLDKALVSIDSCFTGTWPPKTSSMISSRMQYSAGHSFISLFQRDPHRGYIAERLSVVTKCLLGFVKEGERGGGVYYFIFFLEEWMECC